MTTRYVHTNIVSKDWQALTRFYQEVFDCRPVLPQQPNLVVAADVALFPISQTRRDHQLDRP